MYCNKCGAEIKDGAQFCMNCGSPVKDDKVVPITMTRNKVKILVTGLIILALVIGGCLFARHLFNKGYYENIPWGASSADANKILNKKYPDAGFEISDSSTNKDKKNIFGIIMDYEDMDVSATPLLTFNEDDELEEVVVYYMVDDDSDYTIIDFISDQKSIFDKKYGESETIDTFAYKWETSESEIIFGKNGDKMAVLMMEPRD